MAERFEINDELTLSAAVLEDEGRVFLLRYPLGSVWLTEDQVRGLGSWLYGSVFREHPQQPGPGPTHDQALALLGFDEPEVRRLAEARREYLHETGQSVAGGDGLLAAEQVAHHMFRELAR